VSEKTKISYRILDQNFSLGEINMRKIKMPIKYDPKVVEAGRYQKWLNQGVFLPNENPEAKPYSIVLPPPNVTGKLHLGHAWDTTLQDMLIRQKRMQGYDTVWLPGMDHAGIATQAKVEAKLRSEGISRYDLGRKVFVNQVWQWKDKYADTIHKQWGKMGLSLDYTRERFTLDKGFSSAVKKVFVELYNKGLIYRGKYIINWDPQARTALSDIEVIHKDDKGAFYHVKYPFADKDMVFNNKKYIEIATTRPETMMGDTAVAVNPRDERYKKLVGTKVIVPLSNRKIPIISDQYVDPNFGTGMVKITPAHDPNDFQVGKRHGLKSINTMNEDATMNENAGKYEGLDRFEARKAIVDDLNKLGLLIKVVPIIHAVGHSERTGVQVEARLSTQWFVRMKPLAKAAIEMQQGSSGVEFVPKRFEHTFLQWMENIHDWVISRQLWWGHRIPAWYQKQTGEIYVGEEAPADSENWKQDTDVLDTWFSSALWPFVTMGWPDTQKPDYKKYFPINTLVTGYDIIPFWVARMIFQSIEFTGEMPFKKALIHGLMRDEHGVKMSKSLGNGIDPMDIINKYGADALRWFLSTGSTDGQDVRFSYEKMDAAWNFINKIWNASRFVILNLEDGTLPVLPKEDKWDLSDRWILSKLNKTVNHVSKMFDKLDFGEADRSLYDFIWNDFCDWYIEMSKSTLNGDDESAKTAKQQALAYILDQILRLLHPIMPFVTEDVWQQLPHEGISIVTAAYPVNHEKFENTKAEKEMASLMNLIKAVRNIRAEANAPFTTPIDLQIKTDDVKLQNIFESNQRYIDFFTHTRSIEVGSKISAASLSMTATIPSAEVFIPLHELVDLKEEVLRLNKEINKYTEEVKRATQKLKNRSFVERAPKVIVEKEVDKKQENQEKLDLTLKRLKLVKQDLD